MNLKLRSLLLISAFAFIRCGSSTPTFTALKKPVSMSISKQNILFAGNEVQLGYIADQYSESLTVIDTLRQTYVDTAEEDQFDYTPLPIGGSPVAVAVDDTKTPHRVFVADQLNKQIVAYQPGPIDQNVVLIPYHPVELGQVVQGISSNPIFRNSGALSSPTMTNVKVNPAIAKNESWEIKYIDNGQYQVIGTISGVQSQNAFEGHEFTTDDKGVSFFISPGGEETTEDDTFFFSTAVVYPLILGVAPTDLLIEGHTMYILTSTPSVLAYNLDTLTIDATIAIPDVAAIPTHMNFINGKIYISNLDKTGIVFELNTTTNLMTPISTGVLDGIRYVGAYSDKLFLVQDSLAKLVIYNLTTRTITKTLGFDDLGNSFFTSLSLGRPLGFIPNIAGNVDVVDIAGLSKLDTDLDQKDVFLTPEFFDVPPSSSPQLVSVNTVASLTLNESWQVIYEGIISPLSGIDGTITSNQLVAPLADFVAAGVQAGDLVPISAKNVELQVLSVDSPTTVTLTAIPTVQGAVQFDVRANKNWVVVGSKSGVQKKRVVGGESYISDEGQMSLLIRPSFEAPESRGDFFSFLTVDTVDPIIIGNQAMASFGVPFTRVSDQRPLAYILEQTYGQIAIIDLIDYNVADLF